jgi:hypothetical protein
MNVSSGLGPEHAVELLLGIVREGSSDMSARSFLCWLMKVGVVLACFHNFAAAQERSTARRSEMDLFGAPVELRCADDQMALKPSGFFLALHIGQPNSIRDAAIGRPNDLAGAASQPRDQSAVRANIVIYVSVNGAFMPLTLSRPRSGGYVYLIDCRASVVPSADPDDFPELLIRLNAVEDKDEVLDLLKQKLENAVSGGSLSPALFSGDRPDAALIALPDRPQRDLTYGALVSYYVASRPEAAFLDSFTKSASFESAEPGGKIVNFKKMGQRMSVAEIDDSKLIAGPAGAPGVIGEQIELRKRSKVQLRVVNRLLATAIDLASSGMVETFGYCSSIKKEIPTTTPGGGAANGAPVGYVLDDCISDQNRRVPIRVRGFEPLLLEQQGQPIRLDTLLRIRPYSVPYPASWLGSASDRVEILGGPIEDALKRRVTLRQFGLAGCEVQVLLTAQDIIAETLSFPPPPCATIDLSLPREMFAKSAPPLTEGCRPGSNAPLSAPADGRVRCVVTPSELKAGTKALRLSWAAGFDQVNVSLPTNRGTAIKLSATDLEASLRGSLPRHNSVPGEQGAPIYRPVEARYFVHDKACARGPIPLAKDVTAAPTLAEADCKGLPDRMELTFQIDREKSDAAIPMDAFRDRVVQTVALGSASQAAGAAIDINRARVMLPVDFDAERKQRYTSQYVQAAELVVAGARIYTRPDCSDRGDQTVVRLFAKSDKNADFQWPIYGQVFDNDGRALTNCAKSIVERGADDHPYLTFEFISTRAVGARRTIILARSQDLMDKRGLPKVLDDAFGNLIRTAHEWYTKGAALSPIDVLSVSQDGTIRRVFSGEDAALQPQIAEASIAELDRTAPNTPDLSLLRLQPETKDSNRVLIIMDGSTATARQASELRLLGSDLASRKGSTLQFFLSSDSCRLWQPQAPQLKCAELGSLRQSDREKILADAFTSFLNPVGAK